MSISSTSGQGRPSMLENPAVFEAMCQAEAQGMSRDKTKKFILEQTDVEVKNEPTITAWRKDPRVKRRVFEITRDRAVKVARSVDTELLRRMNKADDIPIDLLIKMRKEFVGDNLRASLDEADDHTVGEARDWAAENPDLAKQLVDSFRKATE